HEHEHEHEHHHEHGADCTCGCHDHHDHHHADEVFTSWGRETPKQFTADAIHAMLVKLDSGDYGSILRAKGIVPATDGTWVEFDYVPEEYDVRKGHADYTGRLCVIGANLKEDKLAVLFGL
ncbi:MAG: GTP-binding protein, partial [Oscillibacter sp.]